MSTRPILCTVIILAAVLASLPVSKAQIPAGDSIVRISSYQDDPFVGESLVERIDGSGLRVGDDGRPLLSNQQVAVSEEGVIYRQNPPVTGPFVEFSNNPWPQPTSNEKGNFKFELEERFPLHLIERGPDGKPLLDQNGLQIWKPRDLHLGMTTAFEAAIAGKHAAEIWSGRAVEWGELGILPINSHAFIDFNAFYSPSVKGLFFGVVPYRLPGHTEIKMFETATSWEIVAHESGHAVHAALKPNRSLFDQGSRIWAESLADQIQMWTSLRDRRRARSLLNDTNGNLNQSNALTTLGEVFSFLIGEGVGLRDAFHDKKVSDTSTEQHDRSEVLTGAAYKVFLLVYDSLRSEKRLGELEALQAAGEIMGTLIIRTPDYTPETAMTLEDVAKAYLKVDKELYGGRYQPWLVDEFIRREIFNQHSLNEWLAHEASLPDVSLPRKNSRKAIERMLQASLDELGIGPEFGLTLQSVTRETGFGQSIVRIQLTDGRGVDAEPLDNYGILVFRANGTLADYHSPLPKNSESETGFQTQSEARSLLSSAKRLRLGPPDAALSISRGADGRMTVEAKVMRSKGFYCWYEVFSLENPRGERREIITRPVPRRIAGYQPNGVQILTAEDLRTQ